MNKTVVVPVRMPVELARALAQEAKRRMMARSALMRQLMAQGLGLAEPFRLPAETTVVREEAGGDGQPGI